jgi:pimeloyl-ACP methyl ester carboxylesterase
MVPTARGPHAAIAFLHGSGASNRWAFRYLGDQFARRGIAALIFDKRGVGASGGACCQATFDELAADAVAAVQLLKARGDVRRDRIALLGQSQGGRIAAMAAARSPDVAFVIAVSSSLDTPAEQNLYQSRMTLKARGYPDDTVRYAIALQERVNEYFRTGAGREDLGAAMRAAQKSEWYKFADLDSLPPESQRKSSWWFRHLDLDPRDAWNRVRVPVLAVFGAEDTNSEVSRNLARLDSAFTVSGNADHATRVFPQAGHDLRVSPRRGEPFHWPHYPPGYPGEIIEWLAKRTGAR